MEENQGWVEELIEKLSDLEHQRWARWQDYLHQRLDFSTGKYVMLEKDFERWNRQIHTPYSELSEQEKESDRRGVREYFPLLQQGINKAVLEALQKRDEQWAEHNKKHLNLAINSIWITRGNKGIE